MGDFEKFLEAISSDIVSEIEQLYRSEWLEKGDRLKMRPIHWACWGGNTGAVNMLLSRGCSLEVEDLWKRRPIHLAAQNGHADVIKMLVNRECELECQTDDGKTAMDFATEKNNYECIQILSAACQARQLKQIFEATRNDDVVLFGQLFKSVPLTTKEYFTEMTVLDVIVKYQSKQITDFIRTTIVDEREVEKLLRNKNDYSNESFNLLRECYFFRALHGSEHYPVSLLLSPDLLNKDSLFGDVSSMEIMVKRRKGIFILAAIKKIMKIDEKWTRARNMAEEMNYEEITKLMESRERYLKNSAQAGFNRLHIAVLENQDDVVEYILTNNLINPKDGDGVCYVKLGNWR